MSLEPATSNIELICVGASAGAVEALSQILPQLPPTFPIPIVVVVHVPANRKSILAQVFEAKCALAVKEAEDKEPTKPGTVYFAPPDYHLLVEANRTLSLSNEEEVNFSRPAIDVLFESAADFFGPGVVGIILSGANADGAVGLGKIHSAGGRAVVQNPSSASSTTMPKSALSICPSATVLNLDAIAEYLCVLGSTK